MKALVGVLHLLALAIVAGCVGGVAARLVYEAVMVGWGVLG